MKKVDGSGVIVPLLTPLNADESVNYSHLHQLVNYVVAGGVNAILAMGSTGEFARFSHATRGKIIEEIVQTVAGRIPVYAGVGDTGLKRVIQNIRVAEEAGADSIAVTLPYYYPIRHDDEAFSYYRAVAEATQLPIMLYNIPSTCGASLSLRVVEKMLVYPHVIGIKDSSGDRERLLEEIRRFGAGQARRFTVVIGAEELSHDGFMAGADGVVPSMANPFPRLWANIYQTGRQRDSARLTPHCEFANAFNQLSGYADAWMSPNVLRKKALSHMGICNDICTAPYIPVDSHTDVKVAEMVKRYQETYK